MRPNLAIATTIEDRLAELGGISPSRLRLTPPPGLATHADLVVANESGMDSLVEWVDGCLVEKAMGYEASVVAAAMVRILGTFVSIHRLGLVSGADGFFRLLDSTRGPDVAFIALERLPNGVFPFQSFPHIAPNLVVEVLSPENTKAEMTRKRLEYFHCGVQIVWIVDCTHRSIAVYSSSSEVHVVGETESLDGGIALPGFSSPVVDFFADLDIGQPKLE